MADTPENALDAPLKPKKKRPATRFGMAWLLILILFALLGFGGYAGYRYVMQWMTHIEQKLVTSLKSNANLRADMAAQSAKDEQNRLELNQLIQTTRTQASDLAALKQVGNSSFARWYAAEARYLIRLAQLDITRTQQSFKARGYLEEALQLLAKINDPNMVEITTILKQDLLALQAFQPIDIVSVYGQLQTLDQALEQLPLNQAVTKNGNHPAKSATPKTNAWWERAAKTAYDQLQTLVVIRYHGADQMPFVPPSLERAFYANMHLQMQVAMTALVQGNGAIYRMSLERLETWAHHYFLSSDPKVLAWVQTITRLKALPLEAAALDISHAIPKLDAYLQQVQS